MALTNTLLDEYRLKLSQSNLDQYENRWSIFGGFRAYFEDTTNTIPGAAELINQYDGHRTVSVVVMQRETLTTSSTRTCTMTANQPTSTYVTPSWTTIVASFMMVPSQHKGNYVSYQETFDTQMMAVERAFLTALDTAAYTSLNTNKSTVNAADGNPYDVNVTNDMVIPNADNELFFNEAPAILVQNDLPGSDILCIGSPRLDALVRELNAQGPGNEVNRAFQFGPFTFYSSPRMTVAAGDRDTAFICPKGSLAFLSYVDQDSQLGEDIGTHEWSVQFLPKLGLNVGLLKVSACGDKSALYGGTTASSLYESYQFSFDYSFVTAYDSGSGIGTSIFKAAFSKT